VQLILLTLFVTAMADPLIPGPRQLVLIIDNGAGMDSRLATAKQEASRLIAGLRECDRVAVLSVGEAVGVCCPPTNDLSRCQGAIEGIEATDGPGSVLEAVDVARTMIGDKPDVRIVVLSDGVFEGADAVSKADDVEITLVGQPASNAAITRFAVRRYRDDTTKCQVLAEVVSAAEVSIECRLDILLDDGALTTESFPLPANDRWRKVLELTVPESGRLTARLEPADDYSKDNTVVRELPPLGNAANTPDFEPIEVLATDLRVSSETGTPAESVRPLVGGGVRPWPYLLAAGMLLLAAEWALYQRRWLS